ncbi:MAG: serine/threonine protein kinase, partial [Bryobacteraceae bacterium]|nr:serine/threonine protein kinase [Bryobacteraceae bacterium]
MNPGDRYLHFRIVRLLGRGNFGDVYLAETDRPEPRLVALKVVPRVDDQIDEQSAEAAGAELQKRLRDYDKRVAEVFSYGADSSGNLYIEMEYVDGEDLSALINRGPLTPARAAEIAINLCELLSNLGRFAARVNGEDREGVVHGDLKPKNIRITRNGGIKILDFGIAKMLPRARTQTRNVWASTAYASPERLDTGKIDARSDLWSVGVMLYQMVSGRLPFQGTTPEEVEARIRSFVPPPPIEGCPATLWEIIRKLLARDPRDRYQSPEEALEDLKRFRTGSSVSAPSSGEETVRTRHVPADAATVRSMPPKPRPDPVRRRLKPGHIRRAVLAAGIAGLGWLAYSELGVFEEANALRTNLRSEHLRDLDAAWKSYQGFVARSRVRFLLRPLEQELKQRLVEAADRPIKDYRNSDYPVTRENQWRDALTHLGYALQLDSSDAGVRGRMRLCEGHLSRIQAGAQPRTAAGNARRLRYQNDAARQFQEAASLLPKWPDPYLGLARLYIYELRDPEKAREALNRARTLGHPIGNREKAQLADGYFARVRRYWSDSRTLTDLPSQER